MAKWQNAPVVDTPRWAEAPLVERPPLQERLEAAQARQKALTEDLGSFGSLYDAPLTEEQRRRYDSDVDGLINAGAGIGAAETMTRNAYRIPDGPQQLKEAQKLFSGEKDPIGFWEGLVDNPEKFIPVWGTVRGIGELADVLTAAQRLQADAYDTAAKDVPYAPPFGGPFAAPGMPSPISRKRFTKEDDQKTVNAWIETQAERSERGYSFLGRVGQLMGEMPAFIGDILITRGLYTGSKAAVQTVLKTAGKQIVERQAKKAIAVGGIKRLTAWAVASGVRAGVGTPHRVVETYLENRLPENVQVDDDGNMTFSWPAEAPATTLLKAWGDVAIEMASEEAGETLTKGAGAVAKSLTKTRLGGKVLPKLYEAYRRIHPDTSWADFIRLSATKTGYHGILGEIGEEYLGDQMRAIAAVYDFGAGPDAGILERMEAAFVHDVKATPEMALSFAPLATGGAVAERIRGPAVSAKAQAVAAPRIQGGMTADEMVERLGGETVALEDLAGAVQRAAVDAETKAKLEELFGKKIEVRHEEAAPAAETAPAAAVPAEGAADLAETPPMFGQNTWAAIRRQYPDTSTDRLITDFMALEETMSRPDLAAMKSFAGGVLNQIEATSPNGTTMTMAEALVAESINVQEIWDRIQNHGAATDIAIGYLNDAGYRVMDAAMRRKAAEAAAPGVAEAPTVAERYKESITGLADNLLNLFEEKHGPAPVPEVQGEKSIYEEYLDDAEYLYGQADVWASVGMPQEEAIAEMLKEFDDLEDFPGDSVSREALAKQILTEVYDRAVGQSLLEEAAPATPEAKQPWEMNISNELESLQATESRQGYVSERERARIDELVAKKPTTERYESISDAVADGHLVAPVRIIVDGSPVYVQLDIEQLSGKLKGRYRGATKTQFYNPVTGVEGEASITVMDGKEATPKIAWTRTIPSVGERFWTTADYAEGILDRSPEQGYVPGVRPEEVRVAAGSPGIYKKHNGRWTYVNDPTERKTFVRQLVSEGLPVPRAVLEEYKGEPWADAALAKLEEKPKAKEPQPKPAELTPKEEQWKELLVGKLQEQHVADLTDAEIERAFAGTTAQNKNVDWAKKLVREGKITLADVRPAQAEKPSEAEPSGLPAKAPNVTTEDISYEKAYDAFRWNSMSPEQRAKAEQKEHVQKLQYEWDRLRNFAVNPKQQQLLLDEFEEYRKRYLQWRNELLVAKSRTANPMVTGPARFPTAKNQKRLDAEQKKYEAFRDWDKKALKKIQRKLEAAKTGEQIESEETTRLKKEVNELIATMRGIESGELKGLEPNLFKSSLYGKLKRAAEAGSVEPVRQAIEHLREKQQSLSKPVFTVRHAIWQLIPTTSSAEAPAAARAEEDIKNLPTYERTTARGQTEELKKQMDLALASFRDYDTKYKQAKASRDRCRQGSEQYKKRQAEMEAAEAKRSEWEKKYQDLEDRHNLAQMEDRYETAPTEIGKLAALHNLLLADRDKQDIVYARIQDMIEQMALDAGATEEQAKAARSEANSVITMPRSEFYTDKLEDLITVRIKGQQHREFIKEAYTKLGDIEGLVESKPFEERMKKFTEQLRYDSPQQRAAAREELDVILAEAKAQAKEDRIVAEQQRQQEQERAAKRAIFWAQEAPKITKVWSPMVKPGAGTENEIAANIQAVSKLLGRELTENETGIIRTGSDMYAHRLQDAGDDYLLMVRESDTAFSKRLRDEAAQQLRRRYGVQVVQAENVPKPTSPKSRDDVLKAIKPLSGAQDSRWAIAGFNVEPDGSVVVTDGRRLLVVDRWPLKDKIKAGLYKWTEKKKTDVRFGEPEGKFPKWIDIIPAEADRTNSIPLDSPGQVAQSIKATQKTAAFEYEEAGGAGVVLIRQKDGTTVVMNATLLREGLEALHKLGSVNAVVHTHGIDRPILVEGKDVKGQTLARLVQMPINRDVTDWGAPANKSEFELGDVAPESKEAQPGPPLSSLPQPEPDALTQAIADKDFDTLKELLALGQDANRQRFAEITGIVLPETEAGTENVIGEFVRGEADRYRHQAGRTPLIPDAAAELAAISRRLTGGPASLVGSAVRMFRRNIVSVNRYLRTMGGAGRLIAYDFDVITHAVTKQANNDKADLRKLFHGVSREHLRRAAMVVNERLDPKSQPKKVVDLADRMRQILDRSMNEANALGMTRKVRGKRIPIGGSGKAFPQVPNAKGTAFLKEAKVKGKGSSQVFAWAQEQVKAGRFQDVDEAIIALQQFRDQQLRAVNRYFESSRVELPVDMIEWDPVKILPHLIDRNWMTIEGVRQWGVEKHGQSFPLLRSRIERIRRDYGSDAAQRIENYVQVAFGGRSPASQQAEDISRRIRGFQFITKVGISPITIIRNMCDRLPKGMAISPLGTIRAAIEYPPFVNGFIEAAQKLEERMVRAGAVFGHGSISEGYEAGSFFTELLASPFSESERGNQVFIATVAYHKLMHDIAILERKGVDVTGRLLERVAAVFGQSRAQAAYRVGADIEATILAGQEVSQEQIESFLAEAVSKNAFPMLLNTKPIWWETHPLMKVLAQFKTWPIRQTNLIYQDVLKYTVKTGDPTRLIGFLIGTLLAGEIYNLLRDWLFGKDESLVSQMRKDPEGRRIGMAIFNDLIDGGGVGMIADFTYGIFDWAKGVSWTTGERVVDFAKYVREDWRLTPQALENLVKWEVAPYRQLKGLYNRLDARVDQGNISRQYNQTRAAAWLYKEGKENPTAADKAMAWTDDAIWGRPDYGIGENTLAYELASRQIIAGDIDDAAKYLGNILSRAEDRKRALTGIKISMDAKSPLGPIAQRDRPAFLKSLSPEMRTQVVNVQRNYLRSYNEALRQALRDTR